MPFYSAHTVQMKTKHMALDGNNVRPVITVADFGEVGIGFGFLKSNSDFVRFPTQRLSEIPPSFRQSPRRKSNNVRIGFQKYEFTPHLSPPCEKCT